MSPHFIYIAKRVAAYAIFAMLWIFLSDKLLLLFVDIERLSAFSMAKGFLFVAITAAAFAYQLDDARRGAGGPLSGFSACGDQRARSGAKFALSLAVFALAALMHNLIAEAFGNSRHLEIYLFPLGFAAFVSGLRAGLAVTALTLANLAFHFAGYRIELLPAVAGDREFLASIALLGFGGAFLSFFGEKIIRSREQAKTQAAFLFSLLSSIPDPIFAKDKKGRYILANDASATLLGIAPGSMRGKTDPEIFDPDTAFEILVRDNEARAMAGPIRYALEAPSPAGNLYLEVTKGLLFPGDTEGPLFGICRNQTELRSRERQILLRSWALDAADNAIAIFSSQGAALWANRSFEKAFPDLSPGPRDALLDALQGRLGAPWSGEFRSQSPGGPARDWMLTASPIPQNPQDPRRTESAPACVAVATDITEKKRLERALLEKNEQLEQTVRERTAELLAQIEQTRKLEAAKSRFLANMSHEIRTPINGVIGISKIGERLSPDPASALRFRQISDASALLANLVNDILDFSRLEAKKLALETKTFSLPETLMTCIGLVKAKACEKNLSLICWIDPEFINNPLRTSDPYRVSQIVLNLLSNAVKFTDSGTVALLAYPDDADSGRARISVVDTGIGIARENLPKLFAFFEQLDSSTTRKYGGSGLGLAITKNLCELMGGSVSASSCLGKGSRFCVQLPMPPGERADPDEPPAARPSPLRGLSFLIAEDNELNQIVLRDILCQAGCACADWARNGEEACDMALARPQPYDAVLMDIQMPRLDGYGACANILRSRPGSVVIGQSANAFAEDRQRALDCGMKSLITKPYDHDTLAQTIADILRTGIQPEPTQETDMTAPSPSQFPLPSPDELAGAARAFFANKEKLLAKIASIALDTFPQKAQAIALLASGGPSEELTRAAHSLKGALSEFRFDALRAIALDLENASKNGAGADEIQAKAILAAQAVELALSALRQLAPQP